MTDWIFSVLLPKKVRSLSKPRIKDIISFDMEWVREDNSEKNNDRIYNFCKDYNSKEANEAYVFGHSHKVSAKEISSSSTYFNTGEWLNESSFLVLESDRFELKKF